MKNLCYDLFTSLFSKSVHILKEVFLMKKKFVAGLLVCAIAISGSVAVFAGTYGDGEGIAFTATGANVDVADGGSPGHGDPSPPREQWCCTPV